MFASWSKLSKFTAVALLSAAAFRADATTLRPVSGDDQIREAQTIFRGQATRIEVRRERTAQGTVLISRVTFKPLAVYKGNPGESVTLDFLGGALGNEEFKVEGMPRFETGGEYVLFVSGQQHRACPVIGWSMGSLEVSRRARADGEVSVASAAPGLVRLTASKSRTSRAAEDLDLPSFEKALRARISEVQSGR